jgi:hypothetical protein
MGVINVRVHGHLMMMGESKTKKRRGREAKPVHIESQRAAAANAARAAERARRRRKNGGRVGTTCVICLGFSQ